MLNQKAIKDPLSHQNMITTMKKKKNKKNCLVCMMIPLNGYLMILNTRNRQLNKMGISTKIENEA